MKALEGYPPFLTVKQAAGVMQESENTIRRWCNEDILPAVKFADGGHWRIVKIKLEAMIEKGEYQDV
ncbi:MAG: helix-turn-helix domain-containing protein [Coriobacteriia bacterium]|nr:helix-turn-helix domain-containing protein [Coriobacteriia bacterium]